MTRPHLGAEAMTSPNDVAALVERLTDMSNDTQRAWGPAYIERAGRDMARGAATIAALQAEVERLESERAISIVLPRADTLLRTIMSVMPDGTWRVADIYDALSGAEERPSRKELYNALGYLTRKGFIVTQGYGRYARSSSRKETTP